MEEKKKERNSREIIALRSHEVRRRSGATSPPLSHLFPRSLFSNLLLCFLSPSPLSLLLTVWVFAACCHGYSWSLMHSVTFLWDQLTLGAVFVSVCVSVYYCMCRRVFFVHMSEAVRENEFQKKKFSLITEFLSSFFFPPSLIIRVSSGPQQPPGGFGAAPGLSGGQKDQGIECRHQVDILLAYQLHHLETYHTQSTVKNLYRNTQKVKAE